MTRFLWWPLYLDYKFYWLQRVTIEQAFVRYGYAGYEWVDVKVIK